MAIKWTAKEAAVMAWVDGKYVATGLKPTYDGAVLAITGESVRVMSDVWEWVTYAEVWDGTKVTKVAIGYADMGGLMAEAVVDATPEVLLLVAAYRHAEAVKAEAWLEASRLAKAKDAAMRVAKGKTITVVRGRKVAKGTTGTCIWLGEGKWGWRVGLKDANGMVHWTAASNVEVVLPADLAAAYADAEADSAATLATLGMAA